MAIQYAGGTLVNTLTTVVDKASLFAAIDSAITGAGWSITTTNSSVDKIYQSALTPQSNQIKVRVFDPGGSTQSICLRMMNTTQTLSQSVGCFLYPSSSANYRIIADKYQFVIFVPGSVSSRNFCMASAVYLPPNLVTFGVTTAAFIMGDGQSDTDTSNTVGSFRTSLNARGLVGYAPSQGWSIINSTAVEYNAIAADSSTHPGLPSLVCFQSTATHVITGYRWVDDSALIVEPLIAWGAPTIDNEGKLTGQLWDSFIATESYPADTTSLVDSHTYYSLTNNNNGNVTLPASMRGTLFHVSA
jgi:hypothetical protein